MKNEYKTKEDITEIYVQSPKYGHFIVLIDTEDLNLILKYSWCVHKINKNFYCISTNRQYIQLHRLIMSFPKDKLVDHKNHNCLDNRKENLRICTNKQNNHNQKINKNNTSGVKGVYLNIQKYKNKEYKYWVSRITHNNKIIHLGSFPYTEEGKIQAALRYDQEAKKLFGEFALLNFPD